MDNTVVEMNKITDETKSKLREFDEQEAYFLLCEIFSYAQATKDYARFQYDLAEWKKRYPIEMFSDAYKSKIKYMLSKEFLETVLKGFMMFDELSKKDPSVGLEKLRKIFSKAEQHKDEKKLDSDLKKLYNEYPLKFLKEKYPHIVPQLVSKSNRERILAQPDYIDLSKGQIIPIEIQKNISLISKDALYDFFNIVDRNTGDINSLFDWICKYSRYINEFDSDTKNAIVSSLMTRYAYDLPPVNTDYRIPEMEASSDNLLSLSQYSSIDDFKKNTVIQFLGILLNENELTHDDIYRLNIINDNVQKADEITNIIKKAKIEPKLDIFMEKFPEDKLTPSDDVYLRPTTTSGGGGEVSAQIDNPDSLMPDEITIADTAENNDKVPVLPDSVKTFVGEGNKEDKAEQESNEQDNNKQKNTEQESNEQENNEQIDIKQKNDTYEDEENKSVNSNNISFVNSLRVEGLEKVDTTSSSSSNSEGGASSGGTSISIPMNETSNNEGISIEDLSDDDDRDYSER